MRLASHGELQMVVRGTKPKKEKSDRDSYYLRNKIIESAFECLAEHGYQKTTLQLIADKAACSRELPRYYFGSRDGLIAALISASKESWINTFEKYQHEHHNNGLETLHEICDTYRLIFMEGSLRMRGQAVLIFGAADPGNPFLKEKIVLAQRDIRLVFQKIIETAFRGSNSAQNLDALAVLIYGTLRGLIYQWMTDPKSIEEYSTFNELKNLFSTIRKAVL